MQCKSLWIKASAKCINVNVNPDLLDEEDSFDDTEYLSDESSEEETQTLSNRLSKNGLHLLM